MASGAPRVFYMQLFDSRVLSSSQRFPGPAQCSSCTGSQALQPALLPRLEPQPSTVFIPPNHSATLLDYSGRIISYCFPLRPISTLCTTAAPNTSGAVQIYRCTLFSELIQKLPGALSCLTGGVRFWVFYRPCLGREQILVWVQTAQSRKLHNMKYKDRVKQRYCQRESKNESTKKGDKQEGAEIQGQGDVRCISIFFLHTKEWRELQVQRWARKVPQVCHWYVEGHVR